MGSFTKALPYFSLLLMVLGIVLTFFTGKKPRRVVVWSIAASIILQCISYFVFTGMLHKNMAFLWLLTGTAAGVVTAVFTKLQRYGNYVMYKPNIFFSLSYLVLLLINQLIALLFKAFIPGMIYISALALGLQTGLNLIVVFKAKKVGKTAVPMLLCLVLLFSFTGSEIKAAENNSCDLTFEKGELGLPENLVFNESNNYSDLASSYTNGVWTSNSYCNTFMAGGSLKSMPPAEDRGKGISSLGVNLYCIVKTYFDDGTDNKKNYLNNHMSDLVRPDYFKNKFTVPPEKVFDQYRGHKNIHYYRAVDNSGGRYVECHIVEGLIKDTYIKFEYSYYLYYSDYFEDSYSFSSDNALAGKTVAIYNKAQIAEKVGRPGLMNAEEKFGRWFDKVEGYLSQIDGGPPVSSIAAEKPGLPANTPEDKEIKEQGENPFAPQPVSHDEANNAAAVSGLFAGISGIISFLTSLVGGNISGSSIPPAPVTSVPESPPYTPVYPKPQQTVYPAGNTKPSPPRDTGSKPKVGERRSDGKVFTKNHGWQNENYPEMSMNSIKNTINNLQNDIQRHINNGDKLRTEIAKDELKRNERELGKWKEDNMTVKRVQNMDKENLYQNQAKRWENRAEDMHTAADAAGAISFASDIALAVGTSGASTALAAASKTMNALAAAKELTDTGLGIYDGYKSGKGIVRIAAEQGAQKLIGKAVGIEFEKGKDLYKIDESASKALKVIAAAGETSAGKVVGDAADDMGIVENFGKGVNNFLGGGESK